MGKQHKDKEPPGSFQKFEELTKNLLAVSNKEAREQDAANKRKRQQEDNQ